MNVTVANTGKVFDMVSNGRRGKKSNRKLALDIGNSWREVARNCHVDPEGNERQKGGNND